MRYQILNIQERPQLIVSAANWNHEKWGIPLEAYIESMEDCLRSKAAVPQWYVVLDEEKIIGGLGVIKNDFHDRKDLTPNICAVYVEKAYRCQGIAGELLRFACKDMKKRGVDALYLLTDHTSFYERYGWTFMCMARGDGEEDLSRIYMHREIE